MLRIELTPAARAELRARTREPALAPRTRDRLDMLCLADADSVPPSVGEVGGVWVDQSRPQSWPRPRRRTCWAVPSGGGLDRQRIQIAHAAWRTAGPGEGLRPALG